MNDKADFTPHRSYVRRFHIKFALAFVLFIYSINGTLPADFTWISWWTNRWRNKCTSWINTIHREHDTAWRTFLWLANVTNCVEWNKFANTRNAQNARSKLSKYRFHNKIPNYANFAVPVKWNKFRGHRVFAGRKCEKVLTKFHHLFHENWKFSMKSKCGMWCVSHYWHWLI